MRESTRPIRLLATPLLFCAIAFAKSWRRSGRTGPVAGARAVLGATLLGLAAHATGGWAQAPPAGLTLGAEVQVSLVRGRIPHFESHISVDPGDPQHLLVASITLADSGAGMGRCSMPWCSPISSAFVSFDGGETWSPVSLEGCQNVDPWTAFDTAGNAYLSCLDEVEIVPGRWVMGVALFRSRDGGRSFTESTRVPFGAGTSSDRPFLVVDTGSNQRAGTLYVVRGQFISPSERPYWFNPSIVRSVDGGEHFLEPAIHKINNLDNLPMDAEVLPNGDLAVLYVELPREQGVVPREDWSRAFRLGIRDPRLADPRSWVFVSENGGETFGSPRIVADHPVAAFAVDRSERFPGRWYVAMSATLSFEEESWSFQDGTPSGVYVMYSDDAGRKWSTPVRVSDHVRPTLVSRVMMAVSPDGTVGVAWYDGRNGAAEDCYDVYFSMSADGGDAFAANRRLSSVTSCQNVPGNIVSGPATVAAGEPVAQDEYDIAARWPLGGDYSGLAVGHDGRFHVLWADSRTGVYQLWTRSVAVVGR